MFDFVDLFDNREQALAIWTLIVVAALLCHRDLRPSVLEVVRSCIRPALLSVTLLLLAYIVFVVAILETVGLWSTAVLGVTILWILSAGAAAFWASATHAGDPALLRKIVRATIAWTLVVEFLANLYVFSLPVELILLPVFAFVVSPLDTVAGMKTEYAPAKRLTGAILIGFGSFLVIRAIWIAVSDPSGLVTSVNAMRLLVPIALAAAFVLPAYLVAVYALYSSAFARLGVLMKDRRRAAIAKRTMVRVFGLNRMRLARFSGQGVMRITRASTRQEVEAAIREFESDLESSTPGTDARGRTAPDLAPSRSV